MESETTAANAAPSIAGDRGTKKGKLRTENLRVRRETKRKILAELAALNRKELGRKVTADDYVALAISLIRPEHTEALRQRTLSNKDRLEQRYLDYCAQHGKVSKDEFLGLILDGSRQPEAPVTVGTGGRTETRVGEKARVAS
jgi:hypothetical protein